MSFAYITSFSSDSIQSFKFYYPFMLNRERSEEYILYEKYLRLLFNSAINVLSSKISCFYLNKINLHLSSIVIWLVIEIPFPNPKENSD